MFKSSMKKANILVIGIGHHSRRAYLPSLINLKKHLPINQIIGFDVHPSKLIVSKYLSDRNFNIPVYYTSEFPFADTLPRSVENLLNDVVKKHMINGVIISTDPLLHVCYAKWALKNNIHILMDKPVSTATSVVSEEKQAIKIIKDYECLRRLYLDRPYQKNLAFIINTQRRWDPGFIYAQEQIKDCASRFNVPATSIQAFHADGVWIFPEEIIRQKSHPYSYGYGKCSHSGYHFFDMAWQFYLASSVDNKNADSCEVISSFLMPEGLYKILNNKDYVSYFGSEYTKNILFTESELKKGYNKCGEIDASIICRLLKKEDNVCNMSINLVHNSFSRRSWMVPRKDLYKGNGRVRHQFFCVEQGPFQCIQIHSYQANDNHNNMDYSGNNVGEDNNFDIYVFRNSSMFGKKTKPLEIIKGSDLVAAGKSHPYLLMERAKERAVTELVMIIVGVMQSDESKSNILTHKIPMALLSSAYLSNARWAHKKNPIVKFKLEYEKTK